MADDFTISQGSGATIRAIEKSSKKSQVVVLDLGGSGAESLLTGTLPVSVASLPLPSGASTESTLSSLNAKVTAVNTGAVVVSSSALPSGASTAAKQPALGTAGSASSDVITIQGIASMVAVKVDGSAVNQPVVGNVAHDGADSGAPIKVGGRARSSEITAVASDDRADFISDLVGKQIVLPYANPENFVSGCISTAMTGTTSTSLIAAPGAGLRNYITQITVSNSHATVGTDIIIQDGSGGTTLYVIPAAAVYGGAILNFPTPLRQPTANTALYCANVTTGSSIKVSASGYKGA